MRALWLPDILRDAGVPVATWSGWQTRGRELAGIDGVVGHHTASRSSAGNMPSLAICITGRPDLKGPLCNAPVGRDGLWMVIASGVGNHAGDGRWPGFRGGNAFTLSFEAENNGLGTELWQGRQLESLAVGTAAILKHLGYPEQRFCTHYEWATPRGRKPDPRGPWATGGDWYSGGVWTGTVKTATANTFRGRLRTILEGTVPVPVPPSQGDDDEMGRRTVMVPGGVPTAQGRWPFWMLSVTGDDIASCNGAPALEGSVLIGTVPNVTIPKPHMKIVGIEPAPDGNGIIATAEDQGTYTLRVK